MWELWARLTDEQTWVDDHEDMYALCCVHVIQGRESMCINVISNECIPELK